MPSFLKCLKAIFHFNRIIPKRSVFLCFLSDSVELMTLTQKKMLRLKWKTGFIHIIHYDVLLSFLGQSVTNLWSIPQKSQPEHHF
jgi:hypothetical protein